MTARHLPTHRGLAFLEFLLALAITAMITAAIATMVSAVSVGETSRRDNRGYIVRTYAFKSRLSAYIARCRAVLEVDGSDAVIWLNDWRGGDTVHATEIRWFIFDNLTSTIKVYYVDFPDTWTEVAQALEDLEYSSGQDWSAVLDTYMAAGHVSSITLIDGVDNVQITTDQAAAIDSIVISFNIEFEMASSGEPVEQVITIRILRHEAPIL